MVLYLSINRSQSLLVEMGYLILPPLDCAAVVRVYGYRSDWMPNPTSRYMIPMVPYLVYLSSTRGDYPRYLCIPTAVFPIRGRQQWVDGTRVRSPLSIHLGTRPVTGSWVAG